jgi:hypothetical protein
VRLNLVWDGRLSEAVSLGPENLAQKVWEALSRVGSQASHKVPPSSTAPAVVAVSQKELDSLLAVRRWFHEGKAAAKIVFSAGPEDQEYWRCQRDRLVAEALSILSTQPVRQGSEPALY